MLQPHALHIGRLIHYIPYARRRVSAFLPPLHSTDSALRFKTRSVRPVTVPVPWTPEEKLRVHRARFAEAESCSTNEDDTDPGPANLEKETATNNEPSELEIWVDSSSFQGLQPDSIVGMGLRGR